VSGFSNCQSNFVLECSGIDWGVIIWEGANDVDKGDFLKGGRYKYSMRPVEAGSTSYLTTPAAVPVP
jgi:hypothetical protein